MIGYLSGRGSGSGRQLEPSRRPERRKANLQKRVGNAFLLECWTSKASLARRLPAEMHKLEAAKPAQALREGHLEHYSISDSIGD